MPREQLVEQLAGGAHERVALLVLVEAGRLADEDEVGVGVSDPEHDLGASLGQPAARAAGGLRGEGRELGFPGQLVSARRALWRRGGGVGPRRSRLRPGRVSGSHSLRRNNRRLRKVRRSSVARRCRETRTPTAGEPPSSSRNPGRRDRGRPCGRAPRSDSRRSCTRTRRSASLSQCRHGGGRNANQTKASLRCPSQATTGRRQRTVSPRGSTQTSQGRTSGSASTPSAIQGSLRSIARTSATGSAKRRIEPDQSSYGPPRTSSPRSASSSMNAACSSHSGCSRGPDPRPSAVPGGCARCSRGRPSTPG